MKKCIWLILFVLALSFAASGQLLPDDQVKFGDEPDWSNPLADGLKLWIPMVEAGNAVDFSFSDNGGVITGAVWDGEGLCFSNITDYVSLGGGLFGIENAFSVTLDATIDNTATSFIFSRSTYIRPIVIKVVPSNAVRANLNTTGDDAELTSDGNIFEIGELISITTVWDGATFSLYINGILNKSQSPISPGTPSFFGTGRDWRLGRSSEGGTDTAFNGSISDVKIYNRALSATEIQALYINPNQLIKTTPIWMYYEEEAPPGITGNIFYSPIFGGSILK